ncbi:hypothetical protein FA15DRAFT_668559 [Coprinopsis marcescibilis]|uniref:Glycosyltransferase 61 catalytic domain-containing protein n=1 Tax=Coprinopsis marcescibilis TaxID=230819 RepID=A0A5C3KY09_COPMA|nr:hypothetical protein FA15DRAFT_668559 [Coprinopsis marcescibilis]
MGPFRRTQKPLLFLGIGASLFIVALWTLIHNSEQVTYFVDSYRSKMHLSQQQEFKSGLGVEEKWTAPRLASTTEETTIPSVKLPGTDTRQSAWVDGFAILDKLYLRNGTFYIVTSGSEFPSRDHLIAKWLKMEKGVDLEATDKELQFLHPSRAKEVLGEYATIIPGFSVVIYDPGQFMHHFYHWWGEIIIGMWRVYSTLAYGSFDETDADGAPLSVDSLPFPSRFLLPAVESGEWRDKAGLNGPLMRAAFPGIPIEKADYWADLAKLDTTVSFERAMVINRHNSHKHRNSGIWFKMMAGTMNLTAPDGYWEPIRKSLLVNTVGSVPVVDSQGRVVDSDEKPIVTYISRQGAGRRLIHEHHLELVKLLKELEKEGLCRLEIPMMERLSIKEQLAIGAKTTILVGVHGNGLTHQLLMPRSLRSAVFEILDPPSYTFDYEMLARNMGHKHYAVNNDTLITFPKGEYHKGVRFSPGFHGNTIPVYAPVIADMIRRRLTEPDDFVED